jgi:hypothetical protein
MTTSTRAETDGRYKWVALTNTTAAVFVSSLDGSIVIISLLWTIMGYRLVRWPPSAGSATCSTGCGSTTRYSRCSPAPR